MKESKSVNVIFAALCWSLSLLGPPRLVYFFFYPFILNPACTFFFHVAHLIKCPRGWSAFFLLLLLFINFKSITSDLVPHTVQFFFVSSKCVLSLELVMNLEDSTLFARW